MTSKVIPEMVSDRLTSKRNSYFPITTYTDVNKAYTNKRNSEFINSDCIIMQDQSKQFIPLNPSEDKIAFRDVLHMLLSSPEKNKPVKKGSITPTRLKIKHSGHCNSKVIIYNGSDKWINPNPKLDLDNDQFIPKHEKLKNESPCLRKSHKLLEIPKRYTKSNCKTPKHIMKNLQFEGVLNNNYKNKEENLIELKALKRIKVRRDSKLKPCESSNGESLKPINSSKIYHREVLKSLLGIDEEEKEGAGKSARHKWYDRPTKFMSNKYYKNNYAPTYISKTNRHHKLVLADLWSPPDKDKKYTAWRAKVTKSWKVSVKKSKFSDKISNINGMMKRNLLQLGNLSKNTFGHYIEHGDHTKMGSPARNGYCTIRNSLPMLNTQYPIQCDY